MSSSWLSSLHGARVPVRASRMPALQETRVILYRLGRAAPESEGEGEDWDLWFASLRAAKRWRAQLIQDNPRLEGCRYDRDYEIERVRLALLPAGRLALAILNRRGYVAEREIVVAAYAPKR